MRPWMNGRDVRPVFAIALTMTAVVAVLASGGLGAGYWAGYLATEFSLEKAGQIGDFVGGLANPMVSMLALVWLVKGVLLQRKEMDGAGKAQADQLRLAALTALIEAKSSDADLYMAQIQHANEQLIANSNGGGIRWMDGKFVGTADAIQRIRELGELALKTTDARRVLVHELEAMLTNHHSNKATS